MNKRFLIIAGLVLLIGGGGSWWLRWHSKLERIHDEITDKDRMEAAQRVLGKSGAAVATPTPVPLSRKVRLGIGGLGLGDDEQNGRLGDMTLAELQSAKGFELVERQALDAVLQETQLSLSGLVRAKDAVRVGKLLRADWFLLGTRAKVNGTNSLVVRMVDARTGIMEDATVLPGENVTPELAKELAAFVVQSRKVAAEAKQHVYLAVGAFEDLSLNNRQADFPAQLRGYLTAAYRDSSVNLLERENVEIMLQEMRLDLAGLTEEGSSNAPLPTLQSAFWLVDGSYQSYETTNLQVEAVFRIQRIFGTSKRTTLRAPAGEPICAQIKETIDKTMKQYAGIAIPSRVSEIKAQMGVGQELMHITDFSLVWVDGSTYNMSEQEQRKRKRNVEEAIRAFDTVLLLDPGNRAAKMNLAVCYRQPVIWRIDEARNIYREVIEDPMEDKWSQLGRQALLDSFPQWMGISPEVKVRWFETAGKQTTNSSVGKFYMEQAEQAREDLKITRAKGALENDQTTTSAGEDSEMEKLAEKRLLDDVRSANDVEHGRVGHKNEDLGLYDFKKLYGTNNAAAARRMAELFPQLTNQAPDLAAELLLLIVSYQVDTNTPLLAQFQQEFPRISEQPKKVFHADQYWTDVDRVYEWGVRHQMYSLATQVMEGRMRAVASGLDLIRYDKNQEKIELAYADWAIGRWQQALELFDGISNQPVFMRDAGLWNSNKATMVLPRKAAAKIRQEHGLPAVNDPREFELSKAFFNFPWPGGTFAADDTGVWIGIKGKLFQLAFDLKSNSQFDLPISPDVPVNVICLTPKTVWIGTSEAGLLEFDRATRKCIVWVEKDGLMMNTISSLHADGETLWIGYGQRAYAYYGQGMNYGGGLGKMDLGTRHCTAFTLSLTNGIEIHRHPSGNMFREPSTDPTRRPVLQIATGELNDVWFVTEDTYPLLRRFRASDNVWTGPPDVMWRCSSFAKDGEQLLIGVYSGENDKPDKPGPLGVNILNMKDGKWRGIKEVSEVPSGVVTKLALDGRDLWIGGRGYIAMMDLEKETVRKYAFINAQAVDGLQVAGGYLWAQYGGYMHRALLDDLH